MKKVITSFLITMFASGYAQAALNYPEGLQTMPTAEQRSQFEASFEVLRGMFDEVRNLERNVWLQERTLPALESEIDRLRGISLTAELEEIDRTNLERLQRAKTARVQAVEVYNRLAGYYRVLINDTQRAFGMVGIDLGLQPVSPTPNRAGARQVRFAHDVHGVFTGPSDQGISSEEFQRLVAARGRLRYQVPPFRLTRRYAADAVDNAAQRTIPTLQEDGSLRLDHTDGTFTQTERDAGLAQLYAREHAQHQERERRKRRLRASQKVAEAALARLQRAEEARQARPLVRSGGGLLDLTETPPASSWQVDVDHLLASVRPSVRPVPAEIDVDEVWQAGIREEAQRLQDLGIERRARVEGFPNQEEILVGLESTV